MQLAIAKIEQERRYRVGQHHGVIRRIRRQRYVMGDLLRRIRSNLWHRCVAQWPFMHVSSACSTAPQSPRTRASTPGHGPGNVPVLISRQAEKKEKESVPHWGHWVGHIDEPTIPSKNTLLCFSVDALKFGVLTCPHLWQKVDVCVGSRHAVWPRACDSGKMN